MMNFLNISFIKQVYFAFTGIVLLTLGLGFSYNTFSSYKNKKESFIHESELQASLIADSSVAPLLFFDKDGLTSSLLQLKKYKNIMQVSVYDKQEKLFASYSLGKMNDLRDKKISSVSSETFIVKRKITIDDQEYGTLYLEKNLDVLNDFISKTILNAVTFSIALFFMMAIFTYKLAKKIIKSYPKADLIIANNVLAHIPDLKDFIKSTFFLLKEDGVLSVEFPHILNLIKKNNLIQFMTSIIFIFL